MVQERARRYVDVNLLAAPIDVEAVERLDRRFGLALGGTEGGEVVPSDKALRRPMHRRRIERARDAPGALAVEREIGAAIDNAVEVMPFYGREPRVEIGRHDLGGEHRDRMRTQMRVERVAHRIRIPV